MISSSQGVSKAYLTNEEEASIRPTPVVDDAAVERRNWVSDLEPGYRSPRSRSQDRTSAVSVRFVGAASPWSAARSRT